MCIYIYIYIIRVRVRAFNIQRCSLHDNNSKKKRQSYIKVVLSTAKIKLVLVSVKLFFLFQNVYKNNILDSKTQVI